MTDGIKTRIERINGELLKFYETWTAASLEEFHLPYDAKLANRILEPGIDLLERGGKRWRPLLMTLFCEALGGGDKAIPFTPVVEIAHNGTLIVDDIEDKSDMRRGGPAAHLVYGEDMAINSGAFMCFIPSLIIDRSPLEDKFKLALYRFFLKDLRNLHIGQGLDIQWHRDFYFFPSVEQYFLMCRLKTGSLAGLSARMGAVLGGASNEAAEAIGKLCEDFGVAFQIIDDVKNLTSRIAGKIPGDDIIEGKKSLPVILFAAEGESNRQKIGKLFEDCAGASGDAQIRFVEEGVRMLNDSGAVVKAEEQAMKIFVRAKNELLKAIPASEARTMILEVFKFLS